MWMAARDPLRKSCSAVRCPVSPIRPRFSAGGAEVGDGPSGPRTNPDALSNACAHFVVDLRVNAGRDLQRDSHPIRDSFVERARFGQTRHGNFQMAVGLDVDGPT